jgi:polysaccharide pyruvyl transferase WcaK-like protein
MKISIVGWYGAKNIGDESFRDVFSRQFSGHDLTFSANPNLNADAIILGGGGVVNEPYIEGLEKYLNPLFAMGVDIAVNGERWDQIQKLPFKTLYVRSKEYTAIAAAKANNISYCPDLAFSLYNDNEVHSSFQKSRKCGFIISQDLTGGIDHLGQLIRWIQKDFDEIVFIVVYTGKPLDMAVTKMVADESRCPYSIMIPSSPIEALKLMTEFDLIISMRFHGIIFATMLGIPFLALSNKGKCSLFCEQERLFGHHIELCEANDVKMLDRVRWLLDNKTAIKENLLNISQRNKQLVDLTFKTVKEELGCEV